MTKGKIEIIAKAGWKLVRHHKANKKVGESDLFSWERHAGRQQLTQIFGYEVGLFPDEEQVDMMKITIENNVKYMKTDGNKWLIQK